MRILRHRRTRHFVAVLVECECGRRFLHRLARPVVACLACGRLQPIDALIDSREGSRREEGRVPRAARTVSRTARGVHDAA